MNCFYHGILFLLERMTARKAIVFRLGYFIDIFLKMNEVKACHFKENNCQCLLSMMKFELSTENQQFASVSILK